MKSLYKVGQKVRIISSPESCGSYKQNTTNTLAVERIGTIAHVLSDHYIISGSDVLWTDAMLEPLKATSKKLTELSGGCYNSFSIPRKNKTPRKVHAPDSRLLKYQRSKLKSLESILLDKEETLEISNILNGFIPNRNCVTAAQKHIGFELTIMMDIVAFFDSVLQEHTEIEDSNFYTTEGYCGQGFATSPMLANIGITYIVKNIDDYLKELYSDQYAFTMYADDIQVSINTNSSQPSYKEADEIIEIISAAFEFYGFKIHPHKTRIRYAKHGYRRILGINVGNDHIRATRKTMRKLRAAKHQKNRSSAGGLSTWSTCLLPRALRPY